MAEVRVIARSVARRGRESQLRELLRGMLAPTRAELGCKLYELYESNSKGRFYIYEDGYPPHSGSPYRLWFAFGFP